ncbi:RNA-binding cell elongation regulator Jag/EloR [Lutispora thermophila]|uniref:RNA-binding protein KhpB n=1 Tax=Lutispora thermophila DSM 19022 TaxID=1122184 RepID=A0A1M6HZ21_9FIRM|nr:RNA-binding cell elongation regulator Jag/EloR [Lutispora thermophila]SHJ27422.1 spoIIIJ-associated protein [Lutispora thermophila DSM 19022]
MRWVEKTAKTIEEAVELALQELNISKDKVDIEILEQPSKGLFGILGSRLAKVKVTVKEEKKEEFPVKEEALAQEKTTTISKKHDDKKEEKEVAYKFLRDVLNAMDIKSEIKIKYTDAGLYINLIGPKMGMVIGKRGQTLDSLQYLVSLVVNKNNGKDDYVRVVLDTENYRKKREETLVRLANRLADRVAKTRKKVELEPMNPYERRIIHSTLQNHPDVFTYSEGEEPNRKVIIACK